ncbi:thioredoxin fold domain-containing protein [Flavobacteriaceae bacterium]|nr:thioredoxin fold domain-containing protein [Flavobacteriaceae bacterium]
MGRLIIFVWLLMTSAVSAQGIEWMSFAEALEAQKTQPKKIFVDMYTVWCGPCKLYDRNTFAQKDVAAYINTHFYPVKFNAEGDQEVFYKNRLFRNARYDPAKAKKRNSVHDLSRYFDISAYPTVMFLDENGDLIKRVRGYRKPEQLEVFLKFFGTDLWKTIRTQEEYQAYIDNFSPTFN